MKRLCAVFLLLLGQSALAGGACVVAKQLGDSLAIEWVAGADLSPQSALQQAQQRLLAQGYRGRYLGLHPQAVADRRQGHLVIVSTEYRTLTGKPRTSYGCGFAVSATQARRSALENLRTYSWGWKPEFGYRVVEQIEF
jgi:hypothetical protein